MFDFVCLRALLRLAGVAGVVVALGGCGGGGMSSAPREECPENATKCFGVVWGAATPAEVANINVNARDENGYTPLHKAARFSSNPKVVRALVDKGAPVNAEDDINRLYGHARSTLTFDDIALTFTGWGAAIPFFKRAIERRPVLYAGGATPLHNAARFNRSAAITEALIDAGANVNATDNSGWTPLHAALEKKNPGIARALINAGAKADADTVKGNTPLHFVARYGGNVANSLIDGGANVNAKNHDDNTPLHWAALHNNPHVALALVDGGANLNVKNKRGNTPLHLAAWRGNSAQIVGALVGGGANVNAKNKDDNTPLHLAAYNNFDEALQKKIERALINGGADNSIKNSLGKTPAQSGPDDLLALIQQKEERAAQKSKSKRELERVHTKWKEDRDEFQAAAQRRNDEFQRQAQQRMEEMQRQNAERLRQQMSQWNKKP